MKFVKTIAVAATVSLAATTVSAQDGTTSVVVTTAADGTLLYGGLTLPAAAALAGLSIAAFLAAISDSSSASST